MAKKSAGILMFRRRARGPEVLLVHPGGPFWRKKDAGAWSVPKGECAEGEEPLDGARREFAEELGAEVGGPFIPLGSVRQTGGKLVTAWAVEGDFDTSTLVSNTFMLEWPPRSGQLREFPEVDRAEWFSVEAARAKILPSQAVFLDRLLELDTSDGRSEASK